MKTLPQVYGYLGLVPFAILSGIVLLTDGQYNWSSMLFFYGSMIATFLSGAHWSEGLRAGKNLQISLAMLPTVFCLTLSINVFRIQDCEMALRLLPFVFFGLFWMDVKFLPSEIMTKNYKRFRLILTILVSVFLTLGGFADDLGISCENDICS